MERGRPRKLTNIRRLPMPDFFLLDNINCKKLWIEETSCIKNSRMQQSLALTDVGDAFW